MACLARGIEKTGRVVTAATVLSCVAIGAFATSQIVFIKELGLGTAAAVRGGRDHRASPAGAVADGSTRGMQLVGAAVRTLREVLVRIRVGKQVPGAAVAVERASE
ncbi:MAG: hypothetical protein NVS9B1_14110 [Candidatus Dormibacteraceae bacterium]